MVTSISKRAYCSLVAFVTKKEDACCEGYSAISLIYMPGAKHAVHRTSEALGALVAVRIVCGVYAAETEAIYAGPVFYGRYVCCHHAHLRSRLYGVASYGRVRQRFRGKA